MDPHLLRTFVTVAGCGSFSGAARQLGYTQSAVSQHVAALEEDLGATLLHRRPVVPTEAGVRLLDHAGPILLRLDAARADVRRTAAEAAGRLIFGATPLALAYPMSLAVARLRRSMPGLDVTLRVAGRAAVVTGVAAGELDLGLVDGVAAPTDPLRLPDAGALTTVRVAEEPCGVFLPADHPLAARSGLRLGDLVEARWIDAPDVGAPLADLRAAAGVDGVRAAFRYEGTDVASLLTLVAAGHGLAILPMRTHPGVRAVPIVEPRLVHRIELLHGHLAGPAEALTRSVRSGA
ncbi:LysR family transcriptional regulator [Phytohabitans rumicis]|uniref:LysR family transcriptional regulator n=1 Tax=Phytohabitans rumicis TaxID=1076125 RepID=A0A6V8KXU9_9ACTN|nr:LysR family transcriptional regulator [Phytohabitans rumicis]GFJ89923.1 LysR family transcriptional regulator [Phytohabitans rumicis]